MLLLEFCVRMRLRVAAESGDLFSGAPHTSHRKCNHNYLCIRWYSAKNRMENDFTSWPNMSWKTQSNWLIFLSKRLQCLTLKIPGYAIWYSLRVLSYLLMHSWQFVRLSYIITFRIVYILKKKEKKRKKKRTSISTGNLISMKTAQRKC